MISDLVLSPPRTGHGSMVGQGAWGQYDVRAVHFQDTLKDHTMVKMDIEGSEIPILRAWPRSEAAVGRRLKARNVTGARCDSSLSS